MRLQIVWIIALVMLIGCGGASTPAATPQPVSTAPQADLGELKKYLGTKTAALQTHATELQTAAASYYSRAEAANFDYNALADDAAAREALNNARAAFLQANPAYETMEGIVGGVPSLAQFDVDLDAGSSAAEDPASAVAFDVTLPNGDVLKQPGNFFFLLESALWGTKPEWARGEIDLDNNGTVEFGEVLPDAVVLTGLADGFAAQTNDLQAAGAAWEPTLSDAFTALVVMTPTMDELFGAWKDSRNVSGDSAASQQFVATSRLQDIVDILSGLQVIYDSVEPLATEADAAQSQLVGSSLNNLHTFVDDLRQQEAGGTRFTPEQAAVLGSEAQDQATAIAGQVSQIASKLDVEIAE